jgi:hypothetical protein
MLAAKFSPAARPCVPVGKPSAVLRTYYVGGRILGAPPDATAVFNPETFRNACEQNRMAMRDVSFPEKGLGGQLWNSE